MVLGMKATYCKKGAKMKERDFTDGSKVRACTKAWSVFFASLNKRGWKSEKPRPKTQETVEDFILEYNTEVEVWFEETTLLSSNVPIPRWVKMANRIIKSKKSSNALKTYWRNRLEKWKKKKPKKC